MITVCRRHDAPFSLLFDYAFIIIIIRQHVFCRCCCYAKILRDERHSLITLPLPKTLLRAMLMPPPFRYTLRCHAADASYDDARCRCRCRALIIRVTLTLLLLRHTPPTPTLIMRNMRQRDDIDAALCHAAIRWLLIKLIRYDITRWRRYERAIGAQDIHIIMPRHCRRYVCHIRDTYVDADDISMIRRCY